MLKSYPKIVVFVMALAIILAPAAEASTVVFASPPCAAMMAGAEKSSCCGSNCDCSIGETRTTDLSSVMPALLPRFELTSGGSVVSALESKIDPFVVEKTPSESPPEKEQLYQIYSDYRL